MAWVESLQKAIDYIEVHLLDQISLEEVAKQANVSLYHFQRIFMIMTNTSVGEYVRHRRLTLAAQELSSTSSKIIDLAYKYGYDTPESFSKAFRKHHGVTPSDVRKGFGSLKSYNRLSIQVKLEGAEPMKYQIVDRDAFQTVGVKRKLPCENEGGVPGIPEFWGEVNENGTVEQLTQFMNGDIKGLLGITDNYNSENNTIDYWIAAEHHGEIPSGYSGIQFPAAKWIVFEVDGFAPTAMVEAWKKIYSEWIPSNRYEIADIAAIEAYTDPDPYNPKSSNQIWLAVK